MKLASYERDGHVRLGFVVSDTEMVDVEDELRARGQASEHRDLDIHDLIEAGPAFWSAVAAAEPKAGQSVSAPLSLQDRPLLPAVQRPSKICCLALNNSANAERIVSGPKHPALFTKPSSSLVGHNQAIRLKPIYGRVHPEPELAVIIGKKAVDVAAKDAYQYVFGYTAHNDLTSPTMRGEDSFHYRAIHPAAEGEGIRYVESHVSYPGRYKGCDTFAALGPWIVTADEIPDPHALNIQCHVREEMYASDNTVNLFHKLPQVLEFITSYMTLFPGDVVSLGTALASGGTKPGRAVQNADLNQMGGPVSITIERIGRLSNPVERN